jgi:hypothetical protein
MLACGGLVRVERETAATAALVLDVDRQPWYGIVAILESQ